MATVGVKGLTRYTGQTVRCVQ